jgi:hypothetical protein
MLGGDFKIHSLSPENWKRLSGLDHLPPGMLPALDGGKMLGTGYPPLPLAAYARFMALLPDKPLVYVLAVFDAGAIWAGLLIHFENRILKEITGLGSLPQEDLKLAQGPQNAALVLALVSNVCHRQTFGWFVDKRDFEAYMLATGGEDKAEIFQKGIIEKRAVFDCAAVMPGKWSGRPAGRPYHEIRG